MQKFWKVFNLFKFPDKKKHSKSSYFSKTYSQEGEDIILRRIFDEKSSGFFIDVGAHHPIRFSNTYYFYKNGWRGINIDAMPNCMMLFDSLRPEDINLEYPISEKEDDLDFYIFNEPALNTFSKSLAEQKNGFKNFKILKRTKLKTTRLDTLLEKYLIPHRKIDFLNVDVEGFDLQVLKSNNWSKYRPAVVLVESQDSSINDIVKGEIYSFLQEMEYEFFAKTFNTLFFIANEEKKIIERRK